MNSIAISVCGKFLVSAEGGDLDDEADDYKDCALKLWDMKTGNLLRELKGPAQDVHSVAFSPHSPLVAFGSRQYHILGCSDTNIRVWDILDEKVSRGLTAHASSVLSVAFSSSGELLASSKELN